MKNLMSLKFKTLIFKKIEKVLDFIFECCLWLGIATLAVLLFTGFMIPEKAYIIILLTGIALVLMPILYLLAWADWHFDELIGRKKVSPKPQKGSELDTVHSSKQTERMTAGKDR